MSSPHPPAANRGRWGDVVQFLGAALGVLLVGITPNPPVTVLDWVQIVAGAVLTAAVTTRAVRRWVQGWSSRLGRLLRRRRGSVLLAVLLVGVVAGAVPAAWDTARGLWFDVHGCPHPVQLRVVADPETVATARDLGDAYERATAADDHRCPSARVFVFEASTAAVTGALASADGWGAAALRDLGPHPDVWLAATAHAVDQLPGGPGPATDHVTVARSPLVLAVPAAAGEDPTPDAGWSALVRDRTDRGEPVVRPNPVSSQLGLLGTALLYGPPAAPGTPGAPPPDLDAIKDVERRLTPVQDTAGLLCALRDSPAGAPGAPVPPTAVVTSEQEVARYNAGLALSSSCGKAPVPADRKMAAVYPPDTGDQDLQFVVLASSGPVQRKAATAFRTWLRGDAGAAALVGVGLRPVVPWAPSTPLTEENGVDPTGSPASEPLGRDRWTRAETAYATAQRPNRLLFLLDTSGTMARRERDGPRGTRGEIAADAVRAGIARLGQGDEFGLWYFPGDTRAGYTQAVPVGPRTDASVATAGTALNGVGASGNTPLFSALVEGATALAPDDRFRQRALVVLTDGENNVGAATAAATAQEVAGRGVQVIVVTVGEGRCDLGGLPTIVGATGGDCVHAEPGTVAAVLQEKVAGLRGGR